VPGAQVALDAGYSDQPHMVREFVALAGAPPQVVCRQPSAPRESTR
jgi:AraC-like DNA-binding protein